MNKSKSIQHIAILPDGTRRWARANKKSFAKAYTLAAKRFELCIKYLMLEKNVKFLTMYGSSLSNHYFRTKYWIKEYFGIHQELLKRWANSPLFHDNKICIKIIGERSFLDKKTLKSIDLVERATGTYKKYYFIIPYAYDGRLEILRAVEKIQNNQIKIPRIDELLFNPQKVFNTMKYLTDHFYMKVPEPEIVLRTMERRNSGLHIFQSAYSEFFWISKFWNDITKKDLENVIEEYNQRYIKKGS